MGDRSGTPKTGIHWGYPALEWRGEVAHRSGEYSWDHVEGFMRGLFGWLNANADTLSIERWFIYESPPVSTSRSCPPTAGLRSWTAPVSMRR
ncbi:MAG: hypothetical protein U0531_11370 [Dehalococcoidia bacterium]